MIEVFEKHIETLGEILLTFKVDAEKAIRDLDEEKTLLESECKTDDEYLAPALYNALAAIRTSPEQEKPTAQLLEAISDARDELMIILEAVREMGK